MSLWHLSALAGLLTDVAQVRTIPLSFPYHAQNQQCKAIDLDSVKEIKIKPEFPEHVTSVYACEQTT